MPRRAPNSRRAATSRRSCPCESHGGAFVLRAMSGCQTMLAQFGVKMTERGNVWVDADYPDERRDVSCPRVRKCEPMAGRPGRRYGLARRLLRRGGGTTRIG